jgi:hypothetical protein
VFGLKIEIFLEIEKNYYFFYYPLSFYHSTHSDYESGSDMFGLNLNELLGLK